MLIKVTTRCSMGCSHCMERAGVQGEDMTRETFIKALDFAEQVEAASPIRLTLLSGGEPTDHPEIVDFIALAEARQHNVMLLTNGLFLDNEELRDEILSHRVFVQVTNDPRFYPREAPIFAHPGVTYIHSLSVMFPMGRFEGQTHEEVPTRNSPTCFNVRSVTRALRDVQQAVAMLRARGATNFTGGFCTPSISADGSVVVGECRFCPAIGTVDSTPEEITEAIDKMKCNDCGLCDKLNQEQKRAIGESFLFSPHERLR